MTVMGYNVKPDVNDHEPVVGVEYTHGTTATLFIEQQYSKEEIEMTADEMRVLRGRLLTAIKEIEWMQASWVYAQTSVIATNHLMRKGEHGEHAATVCGKQPPQHFSWSLEPVVQHPGCLNLCKRCKAIYDKSTNK